MIHLGGCTFLTERQIAHNSAEGNLLLKGRKTGIWGDEGFFMLEQWAVV